ncbi:MAG: hypothetical protein U0L49_05145 [Eubacterium sp.]|nr:hypothetical protein [Eubacterium sp.]
MYPTNLEAEENRINPVADKPLEENRRNVFPIPIGIALLTVVFLTLCLFTFAAISLKSSVHEKNQSQQNADRQQAYYAACSAAEEKVAALNLEAAADPDSAESEPAFSVPVQEGQELSVKLVLDGSAYRVTEWKVVNTDDWSGQTTLNVMNPDANDR